MFRPSAILFLICLSFIVGIGFGEFIQINNFVLYIVFLLAVIMAVFLRINFHSCLRARCLRQYLVFLFLAIIGLSLGMLRFNLSLPKQDSAKFLEPGKITFFGNIAELPNEKLDKQTIILDKIEALGKIYTDKILVSTYLYPSFDMGERLQVTCDLKEPGIIEEFDYGKYLANRQIFKVCYRPQIKVVNEFIPSEEQQRQAKGSRSIFENISYFFAHQKTSLIKKTNKFLSPPQSALVNAMILGDRAEFEQKILDAFSQSGVVHIISISGTHIALLSGIIFWIFIYLGIGRQKSFNFIVMILFLYILLIGFNPPAIRSAIMGLIVLYGYKTGRLSSLGPVLSLSAAFLLALSPRLLLGDVGFQLSFLAVIGLIFVAPYFSFLLKNIVKWKLLRQVLSMTLAAQVITWPLTVYYFGIFSLIAPITNALILALPLAEIFMVASVIFLFVASVGISAPIIFIFSAPVYFSASAIILISSWMSRIPFGHLQIGEFSLIWVFVSYVVLGMIYFLARRRVELEE
jgi:competence protein ComEC